jgi:hypothetical protein
MEVKFVKIALQTVVCGIPTCKKAHRVELSFVGCLEKMRPGSDQHLPGKCSDFPPRYPAEHCQSLEAAVASVREHYLKVDPAHTEFCKGAVS